VLRAASDVPYTEIAPVVERSPEYSRPLYRRARVRLGDRPGRAPADPAAHRRLLAAFLPAPRGRRRDALVLVVTDRRVAVLYLLSNPAKLAVLDAPRRLPHPAEGA
jgi:hypothetical protein